MYKLPFVDKKHLNKLRTFRDVSYELAVILSLNGAAFLCFEVAVYCLYFENNGKFCALPGTEMRCLNFAIIYNKRGSSPVYNQQ